MEDGKDLAPDAGAGRNGLDEELQERIRAVWQGLRERVPGFTPRRAQNEMIAAVARALATSGNVAAVEAPTGVGKSLAYLAAGVPIALAREKKLVVSTGTVALQAQLVERDLPAFLAATGIEAAVAIAKGRPRYLCPRNLAELLGGAAQESLLPDRDGLGVSPLGAGDIECARRLDRAWSEGQWDGDLDRAPEPLSAALRGRITTTAAACTGRQCRYFASCPLMLARARVREADIVVTNHALLLAALALGDEDGGLPLIAPPGDMLLVVDEAHHLPRVAIDQGAAWLPLRAMATRMKAMLALVGAVGGACKGETLAGQTPQQVQALIEEVASGLKGFHELVNPALAPTADNRDPLWRAPGGCLPEDWRPMITQLAEATRLLGLWFAAARLRIGKLAAEDPRLDGLVRNVGLAHDLVQQQIALWQSWQGEDAVGEPPVARWLSAGREGDCACHASPVAAGQVLRALLWSRVDAVLLTSATLSDGGDFRSFARDVALPAHAETMKLDSPFDLPRLAELVVPRFPAEPNDREGHPRAVADFLQKELDWARGSLVLFTSRWKMEMVAGLLAPRRRLRVLVQGEGNKSDLIAEHLRRVEAGEGSVLFGLNSFGEGLDLPGAACTTVVITQVPFAVPTDPQTATLGEWVEGQGRSAFGEVAIPHALRMLTQFAGRLIRGPEDTGRIVILDSRLLTKGYGRRILDALPPFRRVLG